MALVIGNTQRSGILSITREYAQRKHSQHIRQHQCKLIGEGAATGLQTVGQRFADTEYDHAAQCAEGSVLAEGNGSQRDKSAAIRHVFRELAQNAGREDGTAKAPVCLAGSVSSYQRLDEVKDADSWTFTIGGAFFENKFDGTFAEQIDKVVDYMAK